MENLNDIVGKALSGGEQQDNSPGDYINEEDGLLYCGNCHTPKQQRLGESLRELFGREIIPAVCKCAQEKLEREEREHKEQLAKIERERFWWEWLSKCFVNDGYHAYTFDNDRGFNPELIATARDFVNRFDYYKARRTGLMFLGNVGSGKTFAAACIANELLKRGVKVVFRTESELLREACDNDRSERLHNYLARADLFVLDDFGACIKSERQTAAAFPYIDAWSAAEKPLIVTTNLNLKDFKETADTGKERLSSRVLKVCSIPISVNGKDVRREMGREKYGRVLDDKAFNA